MDFHPTYVSYPWVGPKRAAIKKETLCCYIETGLSHGMPREYKLKRLFIFPTWHICQRKWGEPSSLTNIFQRGGAYPTFPRDSRFLWPLLFWGNQTAEVPVRMGVRERKRGKQIKKKVFFPDFPFRTLRGNRSEFCCYLWKFYCTPHYIPKRIYRFKSPLPLSHVCLQYLLLLGKWWVLSPFPFSFPR